MQLLHVVVAPLLAGLAHFGVVGARSLGGGDLSTIQLSHRALDARQSSGPLTVPAQCKSTCDPVNSFITDLGTCPVAQCCTPSFETAYFNCVKCVGGLANLTDYSSFQGVVDNLLTDCRTQGIALPKLTFPGQNSTRPLSTLPLTATHITSLSAAPNATTTRVNPPITPVSSGFSSPTFTQITITSLPSTTAPSTAAPAPTNSAPTSAGLQTTGDGRWWVWVGLLVVGRLLNV